MGNVLLGETEECEDNRKYLSKSFYKRRILTVSHHPDLRAARDTRAKTPKSSCERQDEDKLSKEKKYCITQSLLRNIGPPAL